MYIVCKNIWKRFDVERIFVPRNNNSKTKLFSTIIKKSLGGEMHLVNHIVYQTPSSQPLYFPTRENS